MKIRQLPARFQQPDLFDWAVERELLQLDIRVERLARRYRLSRSTAAMIAENAGFVRGDR